MAAERLWAVPIGEGLARIDNIPWFVPNLALGDLVTTRDNSAEGSLEAVDKLQWSGNCTVRVIPYAAGELAGDLRRVVDLFSPLGVQLEVIDKFTMVGLSIPPSVDIAAVKGLLIRGYEANWWDYEESCVGDSWVDVPIR